MGALAAIASAHAITFSNVVITGSAPLVGVLGVDHFVTTGATDIDFTFNHAVVGDNQPLRFGTINITFEASSPTAMVLDNLRLSATTLLLGSGHIRAVETIEDLVTPGVIATFSKDYFAGTFAISEDIAFSRASTRIKVKKTFFLDAVDTSVLDLAGIGIIEQNIKTVPEPTSMVALGLGVAGLIARRRRNRS